MNAPQSIVPSKPLPLPRRDAARMVPDIRVVRARRAARAWFAESPALILTLGMVAFALLTAVEASLHGGERASDVRFAAGRFVLHPLLLAGWMLLRTPRRPLVRGLDAAGVLPVLLAIWFLLGAFLSGDPTVSLARALPLLVMIWSAVAVYGPAFAAPAAAPQLFGATWRAVLVIAGVAVLAPLLNRSGAWAIFGSRYYGPLSATILGPICVIGIVAGLAAWRVTVPGRRRVLGFALAGIFALLLLTRARGSYAFFAVSVLIFHVLSEPKRLTTRVTVAALLVGATAVVAWQWSNLPVSDSPIAEFFRLNETDVLNKRGEIWEANASFWQEHPFFGVGLGRELMLSELSKRSHSAYLSALNEGGLPALVLLLGSLMAAGWCALRVALSARTREIRLLGAFASAIVGGAMVLGLVETTFINAASTITTFLWTTFGAAVAAARPPLRSSRGRRPLARRHPASAARAASSTGN